jgi:hypothetical protein
MFLAGIQELLSKSLRLHCSYSCRVCRVQIHRLRGTEKGRGQLEQVDACSALGGDFGKVEDKSSTTFSFSLSPGFLSFLREKFSPFLYGEFQKTKQTFFSFSFSGFFSFLREKFSLFSSTLYFGRDPGIGRMQFKVDRVEGHCYP